MKSSMYTHNDHYLKYVGSTFYKYLGGVVVKTLITSSTTIVKLSKRTFVSVQSSTINSVPQKQYGSKNEAFWTWRLREWQRCENR